MCIVMLESDVSVTEGIVLDPISPKQSTQAQAWLNQISMQDSDQRRGLDQWCETTSDCVWYSGTHCVSCNLLFSKIFLVANNCHVRLYLAMDATLHRRPPGWLAWLHQWFFSIVWDEESELPRHRRDYNRDFELPHPISKAAIDEANHDLIVETEKTPQTPWNDRPHEVTSRWSTYGIPPQEAERF